MVHLQLWLGTSGWQRKSLIIGQCIPYLITEIIQIYDTHLTHKYK